jgi:hypothetical protein
VSRRLGYSGQFNVPSREELRRQHDVFFSGSFIDSSGAVRLTSQGKPMHALDEVNLFRVGYEPQTLGQMVAYPFALDPQAAEVVVPVVGDFVGGTGILSTELEERGLVRRLMHEGSQVTTPVFVKTMRQGFMPTWGSIRVFKVDGRTIVPNSPAALEEVWDLINVDVVGGLRGSAKLRQLVDDTLRMGFDRQDAGMTFEEYKRSYGSSATLRVGLELISKAKEDSRIGMMVGIDPQRVDMASLPVCGVGIKGLGCLKYDGNFMYHKRGDAVPDHIEIKEIQKYGETAFVVDKRYEGRKGIILPVAHQPWSSQPVGGASVMNKLSFGRENELLRNGAVLSYLTSAVIPLLKRRDVPDLVTPEIAIVTNVVLDDSRRIDDLMEEKVPLDGRRMAYLAVCTEKYGPELADGVREAEHVSRNFPAAREKHWALLSENVGRNLMAIFKSGLTNPHDQNLIGNFSIDGGLADVMDLARMRNPKEFHSTVLHAFSGLAEYYEVAGYGRHEFFLSRHFGSLLESCFGAEAGGTLNRRIKSMVSGLPANRSEAYLGVAAGLVADEFVKLAGASERSVWQLSDAEFMAHLGGDVSLQVRANVGAESLGAISRSIATGFPLYLTEDGVRSAVSARNELNRLRSLADVFLRAESSMSMKEHNQDLAGIYREKFGG